MSRLPTPPLPRGWPRTTTSSLLHVIALANFALVRVRGWCADSRLVRVRLAAEVERFRAEVTMLNEEIRIKDARLARIPARERPHYPPAERLAILAHGSDDRFLDAPPRRGGRAGARSDPRARQSIPGFRSRHRPEASRDRSLHGQGAYRADARSRRASPRRDDRAPHDGSPRGAVPATAKRLQPALPQAQERAHRHRTPSASRLVPFALYISGRPRWSSRLNGRGAFHLTTRRSAAPSLQAPEQLICPGGPLVWYEAFAYQRYAG
jgi:hypothetical protein